MLTILIAPVRMGTQAVFEKEAPAFADWLRQSPSRSGGVLIAGEPERAARIERARTGITIDEATWTELQAAAIKVGL
jgi:uncharacterized oxidoreductase